MGSVVAVVGDRWLTGVIRRLSLPDTLKMRDDGVWYIDVTAASVRHKTSKFYGPGELVHVCS